MADNPISINFFMQKDDSNDLDSSFLSTKIELYLVFHSLKEKIITVKPKYNNRKTDKIVM